jgi:hypothetical protein
MPLPTELRGLNTQLAALGDLPAETTHEWLWGTDPEEPYHADVLLNRNHLLGLLVCRYKHLSTRKVSGPENYPVFERMTIMDKPVQYMSWRELKDTVANLLLEWPAFLDRLKVNLRPKQNLTQVLHLVNLCAARFGELAYTAAGEDIMDDTSETQPCRELEEGLGRRLSLTAGAMRRMAGSLLIMYRHLHLLSICSKVPKQGEFKAPVTKYHYEASHDAFNLLCMHIALPVAARLNYRHDFPGMYNHVSQVHAFFWRADFCEWRLNARVVAGGLLPQQPVREGHPAPALRDQDRPARASATRDPGAVRGDPAEAGGGPDGPHEIAGVVLAAARGARVPRDTRTKGAVQRGHTGSAQDLHRRDRDERQEVTERALYHS